jgi:hypothetical protein
MSRDAADSDATLVAAHTVVNGVTLKAASYEADVTDIRRSKPCNLPLTRQPFYTACKRWPA